MRRSNIPIEEVVDPNSVTIYDVIDEYVDSARTLGRKTDQIVSQLTPKERQLLEKLEAQRRKS